jgi:hypothetical protein
MKRQALMILAAAAALPFGLAHADEADGSQLYRSGMTMSGQMARGQQAAMMATPSTATMAMGAGAAGLTREQVRADAILAMQRGTITRGEKGGFPQ